jgi:hypothetical protein
MPNLWSQDLYTKAFKFVVEAHKDQLIPGTTLSCIEHISLVAMEITAALSVEGDAQIEGCRLKEGY